MFHWVFAEGIEAKSGWTSLGDPETKTRTRQFRSWRPEDRWHAACDLVVPIGTAIHAVCDGVVVGRNDFYEGTWEVAVRHEHEGYAPFVVRYGEVLAPDNGGTGLAKGARVRGGDEIAQVGQLKHGGHMLHFELYADGDRKGALSVPRSRRKKPLQYTDDERSDLVDRGWHPYFERRLDLVNPAEFLQAIKRGVAPPVPTIYAQGTCVSVIQYGDDEADVVTGVHRPAAGFRDSLDEVFRQHLVLPAGYLGADEGTFGVDDLLSERHGPEY